MTIPQLERHPDLSPSGAVPATIDRAVRFVPPRRATTRYERMVKPVVDRLAASLFLLGLAPVLLLVGLAVRAKMGPGLFFRQRRVGLRGRVFTVLKFRTMLHPHQVEGRERRPCSPCASLCHKCPEDPRHTSLGRLLRKLSLDELPQLVNVVRGEMSLVGPRPELPEIVARYEPWQHGRHEVKPGLTGLWQITERGSGALMYESTGPDIEYVERLSLRTDLSILLRTLPAMLGRQGGH